MAHGKRYRNAYEKVDRDRRYPPAEAVALVKETSGTKFDETVELHFKLGVNVRHAEEQLRGTLALPKGLGKDVTIAVFAEGDAARQAEEAGATFVGSDDLVATRVALANQLRSLLEGFWPGAAAVFADVASPIALVFLDRFPTPKSAGRLGEKLLARFLAQHAYCGRRPAAELLERLRAAPASVAGPRECEAKGVAVLALVATLRPLVAQIAQPSTNVLRMSRGELFERPSLNRKLRRQQVEEQHAEAVDVARG